MSPVRVPSPDEIVAAHAPALARTAAGARLVGDFDPKKNVLVRFRSGDRDVVLKVFRQSLRYSLQALRNPFSRWGSRALALRCLARTRVASEIESTAAFRAAGFGTFEILDKPSPVALLFRAEAGNVLGSETRPPEDVRRLVVRASEELGRRQAAALERDSLWLVHGAARLQHVWLTPDDRLLYFDFEDRINPALRVEEAVSLELIDWFFYLGRREATDDDATLAACARAVGSEAIERMLRYVRERRRGRYSGSYRRHSTVVPRIERLM